MARNVQVGDYVYAPRSRVGLSEGGESAFYRAKVVEIEKRSARLQLKGGALSEPIGVSLLHHNIGILVLRIGDLETEKVLLDPLTKSLLQFCRLLLTDGMVKRQQLRSPHELETYWKSNHGSFSHVVFVCHGGKDGVKFATEGWLGVDDLAPILDLDTARRKVFLSLGCNTGYKRFAGKFSKLHVCNAILAPFHDVHGAIGSQFCQTFLSHNLLRGRTTKVAFKKARLAVPGSTSFRLWRSGRLTAGPNP